MDSDGSNTPAASQAAARLFILHSNIYGSQSVDKNRGLRHSFVSATRLFRLTTPKLTWRNQDSEMGEGCRSTFSSKKSLSDEQSLERWSGQGVLHIHAYSSLMMPTSAQISQRLSTDPTTDHSQNMTPPPST